MNVDALFKKRKHEEEPKEEPEIRDMNDLLEYIEANAPKMEASADIDPISLKKLVLKFEKVISKNQDMRMKYADQPEKFLQSEMELDQSIKQLMIITVNPILLVHLVELNTVTSLLSLLLHENTDIAISVINLINELTDEDALGETDEKAILFFVNDLMRNKLLGLFFSLLSRLDESNPDDKNGVFTIFSVLENLIAIRPEIANEVAQSPIFGFLFNRLEVSDFDSNKQYASELLAILLQQSESNRLFSLKLNGMEVILKALSKYKKKDPKDGDEVEYMENLFGCLCSLLLESECKQFFRDLEGFELMIIMIKNKMQSKRRALKTLAFALSTHCTTTDCQRFIELKGLGTLFATFMKLDNRKIEEAEHVMSIIVSNFRNLDISSAEYKRLVNKFKENEYEKTDQLVFLKKLFVEKVQSLGNLELTRKTLIEQGEDPAAIEEELYLERCENGLSTLQLIDLALLYLMEDFDDSLMEQIEKMFVKYQQSFLHLKQVMLEYFEHAGEGDQMDKERKRILPLVNEL